MMTRHKGLSPGPERSEEWKGRYAAYGLVVSSDLPLSNLTEVAGGRQRVTVRRLRPAPSTNDAQPVYEHLNSRGETVYRLGLRDGAYVWSYADVADFVVQRDGRRVGWFAERDHEADAAGLLAGPVLGFALQLLGHVALHGSVVVVHDGAVGLLAPSGYGKSTAAAGLMARGCPLLSDDIAALDLRPNGPWVLPGYPKMKLWPEAIGELATGLTWQDLPQHVSWLTKRILPARALGRVCEKPQPLSALFVLYPVTEGEVRIEPLRGRHAVLALVSQSYNAHLLAREPDVLANQMSALARVAESVPVYQIQYPHGFDHLPQMASAIIDETRSFSPSTV